MAFQTMIFANTWNKDVQWFSKEIQHKPSIVFGSFYETSIALKVLCKVEIIERERDREKAVHMLAKKAINEKRIRIAIVCRNDDEISFLKHHLKNGRENGIDANDILEVTHNTPHYELESKRNKWNHPKQRPVKIVVTHVMGANQFYFRLQEFRNQNQTSGQWSQMNVTFDEIRPQLDSLKDTPFNTVKNVCMDTVYGVAVRAQVLRVRVIRLLNTEELQHYEEYDPKDKSQKIEVFCIDCGSKFKFYCLQNQSNHCMGSQTNRWRLLVESHECRERTEKSKTETRVESNE